MVFWIKVNTDGAATKNPLKASARGIFETQKAFAQVVFLNS